MTLGVLSSVLLGCGSAPPAGPQRVAVQGTITLDGKPLDQAVIRFVPMPEVNGPKASADVAAGKFEIPAGFGPAAGKHRVEIESTDHGGIAPDDEQALAELAAGKRRLTKPVKIPAIYNVRSTLQKDLKADSPNEFAFELVTKR
jgi:hypothetical protein